MFLPSFHIAAILIEFNKNIGPFESFSLEKTGNSFLYDETTNKE